MAGGCQKARKVGGWLTGGRREGPRGSLGLTGQWPAAGGAEPGRPPDGRQLWGCLFTPAERGRDPGHTASAVRVPLVNAALGCRPGAPRDTVWPEMAPGDLVCPASTSDMLCKQPAGKCPVHSRGSVGLVRGPLEAGSCQAWEKPWAVGTPWVLRSLASSSLSGFLGLGTPLQASQWAWGTPLWCTSPCPPSSCHLRQIGVRRKLGVIYCSSTSPPGQGRGSLALGIQAGTISKLLPRLPVLLIPCILEERGGMQP